VPRTLLLGRARSCETGQAFVGQAAAQQMISRVQAAGTKDEVSALLNELARIIVIEARNQFGEDPVLAEVWRVAAHKAACAQLSAVEWRGP
jgi:hypothetical protein